MEQKKLSLLRGFLKKNKIHWDRLERLVQKFSPEKIVLDLSCQQFKGNYYIMTEQWGNRSEHNLSCLTEKLANYCSEFLIHATSVDSKKRNRKKPD